MAINEYGDGSGLTLYDSNATPLVQIVTQGGYPSNTVYTANIQITGTFTYTWGTGTNGGVWVIDECVDWLERLAEARIVLQMFYLLKGELLQDGFHGLALKTVT